MTNRHRTRARRRWRLWQAEPNCWYCGRLLTWHETTLDHFHPRVAGGGDRQSNLRLACEPCNRSKGAALPCWLVCPVVPGRPVLQFVELYLRSMEPMNEQLAFNYDMLKKRSRELAQRNATAIHELIRSTTQGIVEIGRRLHEVRASMNSRTWNAWLRAEFRWAQSTASSYMRIAEKFGNLDCLENFQHTALAELTKDRVDPRAITAAVNEAQSGTLVTRKRARELATEFATPQTPAPKADGLHNLRTAINRLNQNLEVQLATLQPDELAALADDLMEFAIKLRKAGTTAPPATKQAAARRTRKSKDSAA